MLDLLAVGRSVASLSKDLGVSHQTIYNWRRQDLIDRGFELGSTSEEQTELRAARRRIRELETDLAVTKRAIELLEGKVVHRKRRYGVIAAMRAEGLPTNVACRVLGVSESGFYAWRSRPPSARSVRHVWLTDLIHQIHHGSRRTYEALRVHAELRLGHGITVGHNASGDADAREPAWPVSVVTEVPNGEPVRWTRRWTWSTATSSVSNRTSCGSPIPSATRRVLTVRW